MINVVRLWILLSTLLVSAGWILSALHELNRVGYAIVFGIALAVSILWLKYNKPKRSVHQTFHRFSRRFKKLPPFLFLLLALLTFAGGCLYPILNPEANTYRLPRVCHWLWENHWHWIHTSDLRMNIAGCGYEWLAAPLILFTGSDRLVFLINWIPFLMLPGLIFSVFTQLKIHPRTAWWWMWFLASGWCFVFQAGSGGNDAMAVVYALAAVNLALRAKKDGKISDLWLSFLAAALTTGVKQTDVPLAALWLVAAWPSRRLLLSKPLATVAVVALTILVSVAPISFLNFIHYGNWLPLKELKNSAFEAHGLYELNPFCGIIGNLFCIPAQNLWPPFSEFFPPFYSENIFEWNYWITAFQHTSWGIHFGSFENFGYINMNNDKGPGEGTAGIGLGICILIVAAFLERCRLKKFSAMTTRDDVVAKFLRWIPWLLLLVFMAKVGTYENARQLSPYYIFLFPSLLTGVRSEMVSRQRQWQILGIGVMILTVLMVITLPARPLFPVKTLLTNLSARFPNSKWLQVECDRYFQTYYHKLELRRTRLKSLLPAQETVIGYSPGLRIHPGNELAIWLPYGQRSAHWVLPDETLEELRRLQIHYLVTDDIFLSEHNLSLAVWMKQYNGALIGECDDEPKPIPHVLPPQTMKLYVVRINQSNP